MDFTKISGWTTILVIAFSVCTATAQQSTAVKVDSSTHKKKILIGIDSLSLEYFQRRQAFIDSILKNLDSASSNAAQLNFEFSVDHKSLDLQIPDSVRSQDEIQRRDRVGEQLREQQVGLDALLDFGKAIRGVRELAKKDKKKRKPDIRKLPLPTPLEVNVLGMLWANGPTVGPDLFANLDSSLLATLTAEMFWDALHRMARRGFVTEKIVSPQLTMNFPIGPLVVPVEMSAKNLRNRVYEYDVLVDENQMFSYLVAKNYLARAKGKESTNGVANPTDALLMQMIVSRRRAENVNIE
ncbi:MAG: hypothetical protein ACE5I1_23285 [bacterium]